MFECSGTGKKLQDRKISPPGEREARTKVTESMGFGI
jgi:hypothetical protein